MSDKAQLFKYRRASKVNIYSIRGFQDYYYGYMVPNTSYLKWFAVEAYEDGFVLQFPRPDDPTVIPPLNFSNKVFQVLRKSQEWGRMLELSTVGDLNDLISKGNLSEMILVQQTHPKGL